MNADVLTRHADTTLAATIEATRKRLSSVGERLERLATADLSRRYSISFPVSRSGQPGLGCKGREGFTSVNGSLTVTREGTKISVSLSREAGLLSRPVNSSGYSFGAPQNEARFAALLVEYDVAVPNSAQLFGVQPSGDIVAFDNLQDGQYAQYNTSCAIVFLDACLLGAESTAPTEHLGSTALIS